MLIQDYFHSLNGKLLVLSRAGLQWHQSSQNEQLSSLFLKTKEEMSEILIVFQEPVAVISPLKLSHSQSLGSVLVGLLKVLLFGQDLELGF